MAHTWREAKRVLLLSSLMSSPVMSQAANLDRRSAKLDQSGQVDSNSINIPSSYRANNLIEPLAATASRSMSEIEQPDSGNLLTQPVEDSPSLFGNGVSESRLSATNDHLTTTTAATTTTSSTASPTSEVRRQRHSSQQQVSIRASSPSPCSLITSLVSRPSWCPLTSQRFHTNVLLHVRDKELKLPLYCCWCS